ncbi:hypothetical protein CMV_015434 [Castanea mollissima]|uniref:Vinorine synthase-like n=1 Tax=Castanea mollissima TaxID=60419 RepID=A0A8J4RAL7_9ROSI|nr:hypothetical protein CMV_015434 [Castanea mollissima]
MMTKWLPSMMEQWLTFVTSLEPRIHSLTAKTFEAYHASKSSTIPNVIKVQKMADPYVQGARKFTQPYFNQLSFLDQIQVIYLQFEASTLFPPTTTSNLSDFQRETTPIKEKSVLKRFVFSSASIVALKAKYTENLECPLHPSRVEALSAFLWSRYVVAAEANFGPKKLNLLLHAVNLQTRMDPSLTRNSFGNIFRFATVILYIEERNGFVGKVRAAIRKIDNEYVKKLQDHTQQLDFLKETSGIFMKDVVPFIFSSLCRLPKYEMDFGWGNPMWIGQVSLPFKNVVVFIDNKSGDGIEAWLT